MAFQHVTLPLLFDARFILWRLLMFVLFALLVAVVLHWRPQLLPCLVVVHMLMDASVTWGSCWRLPGSAPMTAYGQ